MSFSIHSQTHGLVWSFDFGFGIGEYGPRAVVVGIDIGFGWHTCG